MCPTRKPVTLADAPIPPLMLQALGGLTVAFQDLEASLSQMI
jgi:hypothetical protein